MGGNAFHNTRRLSEVQRQDLLARIAEALDVEGVVHRAPAERADKPDHGDVDVVAQSEKRDVVRACLMSALGCTEPYRTHGPTDSFLTAHRHQVDVAFCPAGAMDMFCAGKSNNDFCVMVTAALGGAVFLSPHGLFAREPRVLLCDDPALVADFLGYPRTALDGVTAMTTDQMFEVLDGGRFFVRPGAAPKRPRPLLRAFHERRHDSARADNGGSMVVAAALEYFAGARKRYDDAVRAAAAQAHAVVTGRQCKELLGGELVRRLRPELDGPAVGELLALVRNGRDPDDYLAYLRGLGPDGVKAAVMTAVVAARGAERRTSGRGCRAA
jgi:hypothetical protein